MVRNEKRDKEYIGRKMIEMETRDKEYVGRKMIEMELPEKREIKKIFKSSERRYGGSWCEGDEH